SRLLQADAPLRDALALRAKAPTLLTRATTFGFKEMSNGPGANFQAGLQTIFVGGAEVDPAIEAARSGFFRRRRETREGPCDAREEIRAGREPDVVAAKKHSQNCRGRTAEAAVAGHIIRKRRRDDKRTPAGIRIRGGIAIQIAVANGSDWTPEIEGVFGVPSANSGIGHGQVE